MINPLPANVEEVKTEQSELSSALYLFDFDVCDEAQEGFDYIELPATSSGSATTSGTQEPLLIFFESEGATPSNLYGGADRFLEAAEFPPELELASVQNANWIRAAVELFGEPVELSLDAQRRIDAEELARAEAEGSIRRRRRVAR